VTSFLDSFVRLPALEPGQSFIWQRSYSTRSAGQAWRRVRVAGFDQTALGPLPESEATVTVQQTEANLELQFLDAPTGAQVNIPARFTLRVRNLGPAIATGVKVSVIPTDGASIGGLGNGPRACVDIFNWNTFQTQLLPGESALLGFNATPTREGMVTGLVRVQQSEQSDPDPRNDELSFTLNVAPEPPIPPILRVRKVRMDFFDHTPITEIEIDQAALNRFAPFTTFKLEASSNLRDWEFLTFVGLFPLAPVTFTDHAGLGVAARTYRLR
jgi:hypothetical protein